MDLLSIFAPPQQQAVARVRAVNSLSPQEAADQVQQMNLSGGLPPRLAEMLRQRRIIDAQVPQNRPVMSDRQLGIPTAALGLDAMRITPDDPTGLGGRMGRWQALMSQEPAAPEPPRSISPQEAAELVTTASELQRRSFQPMMENPRPLVHANPETIRMRAEASRLREMPGAPDVPLPGLTGAQSASDKLVPGAGVRALWANPVFQKAEQAREDAQDEAQDIITDRAKMRADLRSGITPQMRLLQQSMQGTGGGKPEMSETQLLMLFGPRVAGDVMRSRAAIKESQANTELGRDKLGVEKQLAAAQTALANSQLEQNKMAQRAEETKLAEQVVSGAIPGGYATLSPDAKQHAIRSLAQQHGYRFRDLVPEFESRGIPLEDVPAAFSGRLPAQPPPASGFFGIPALSRMLDDARGGYDETLARTKIGNRAARSRAARNRRRTTP